MNLRDVLFYLRRRLDGVDDVAVSQFDFDAGNDSRLNDLMKPM